MNPFDYLYGIITNIQMLEDCPVVYYFIKIENKLNDKQKRLLNEEIKKKEKELISSVSFSFHLN